MPDVDSPKLEYPDPRALCCCGHPAAVHMVGGECVNLEPGAADDCDCDAFSPKPDEEADEKAAEIKEALDFFESATAPPPMSDEEREERLLAFRDPLEPGELVTVKPGEWEGNRLLVLRSQQDGTVWELLHQYDDDWSVIAQKDVNGVITASEMVPTKLLVRHEGERYSMPPLLSDEERNAQLSTSAKRVVDKLLEPVQTMEEMTAHLNRLHQEAEPVEPRKFVKAMGEPFSPVRHATTDHKRSEIFLQLPPVGTVRWLISTYYKGQWGYIVQDIPREMIEDQVSGALTRGVLLEMDTALNALIQREEARNDGQADDSEG